MRLAGVTGHRVFIQDSGRPATGNVPIYTIHRPDLKKPEQVFERIIFGVIFLFLTAQNGIASLPRELRLLFKTHPNILHAGSDNLGRMLSVRSQDELSKKTLLLREVVELLMWELSAISNRKWEDLPELKKKKGVLADHLRQYDWTPGTYDQEPIDVTMLKAQISDLEYQSRQKIQVQLKVIKGQLDTLQNQKQYWLDCLNIYFRKYSEPLQIL